MSFALVVGTLVAPSDAGGRRLPLCTPVCFLPSSAFLCVKPVRDTKEGRGGKGERKADKEEKEGQRPAGGQATADGDRKGGRRTGGGDGKEEGHPRTDGDLGYPI